MKLGTNTIASLKIGSTDISEVRIGSVLVWQNMDADAAAFIAAAGITDATQKSAINTLVVDLKAYSLWTKMKAIYPFVGGSASTHKWNLKDPRDLDAAYRLSFTGGWTHDSQGISGNAVNSICDTFASPNSVFASANSTHLSLYVLTNSFNSTYVDFGSSDGTNTTAINSAYLSSAVSFMHDTTGVSATNTDTRGFYCGTRTAPNIHKLFKNNVQLGSTDATSVGSLQAFKMYIGSYNVSNTASFISGRTYALASIGDGLSDSEQSNLYTAIQTYQTTLSRNV